MSAPLPPASLRAVVRGRVQGVGFRWHAAEHAQRAGLTGGVFNRSDGAVETVAEGPRPALEDYLAALRRGPSEGLVHDIEVEWSPATGAYSSFEIWPSRHVY